MWKYAVKRTVGKEVRYLSEYKEYGLGSNSQTWKPADDKALKMSKEEAERIAGKCKLEWSHLKYLPYRTCKPIFNAVRKSVR